MHTRSQLAARGAAIFCISLIAQMCLWMAPLPYADIILWQSAAEQFASGTLPDLLSPTPPHPGTSIMLPTAALIRSGIPPFIALQLTMAILMSIAITAISIIAFVLRPKSLWWLAILAFAIPNSLYLYMTPPSALAAALSALYVFLLLYMRHIRGDQPSAKSKEFDIPLCWLGVCAGVLLATRIDAGAAIILLSLPYLWMLVRTRIILPAALSVLFFAALNPYLWFDTVSYLQIFSGQVGANAFTIGGFGFSPFGVSLAIVSFFIGFVLVYIRPDLTSLPRDFIFWMLAMSVVMCAIIMMSKYHPIRYFFPLMTIWELFLPLFIFDGLKRIDLRAVRNRYVPIEYVCVCLFLLVRLIPGYFQLI